MLRPEEPGAGAWRAGAEKILIVDIIAVLESERKLAFNEAPFVM